MNGAREPAPLDLSRCAQEPIQIPGSIQPYGILLVPAPDLTIKHVSANVEALLGLSATGLYGATMATILGEEACARFVSFIGRGDLTAFNPTSFTLGAAEVEFEVDCTVHRSASAYIVEFEPFEMPNEASISRSCVLKPMALLSTYLTVKH